MATDLPEWINSELKVREWKPADLARAMGVRSGTVSRILNSDRGVGKDMCRKIAAALKVNDTVVLFHAGYLKRDPEDPTQKLSPTELDILSILENKSEAQKRAALSTLAALFESLEGNGHPDENRAAVARKK